MCQIHFTAVKAQPHDHEMKCKHPWDFVTVDPVKGWYCQACASAVVFCFVCAEAGIYNIHLAPECDKGHMNTVYRDPKRSNHASY